MLSIPHAGARFARILLAAGALGLALSGGAAAQQPAQAPAPAPSLQQQQQRLLARIAILDVERVLTQSAAGKSAFQQIGEQRKRYQEEVSKAEDQLRAEERELVQQRASLSPEAFDERRRGFERKVQDTQRMVQQRSGTIDGMLRNAREQIGKAAIGALEELMRERGFNVVLDRKQIVATDPSLEVTDEVMARVNKRLPSIKVEPPKPQASAPKK